jgi:hypothetical protein
MTSKMALEIIQEQQDDYDNLMGFGPFSLFINATRANQTRRKYQARLGIFLIISQYPRQTLRKNTRSL